MTASNHLRFADKLIDSTGAFELRTEADIPGTQVVTLQISGFLSIRGDDELRHVGMSEIAAHEFKIVRPRRATTLWHKASPASA